MTNLDQITTILSDGQFHDGSSIGKKLGVTRAGVWKIVKKLVAYGIKINSAKGKGYALEEQIILLNRQKILKSLNSKNVEIELFETIKSTNDYLKSLHQDLRIKIAITECQTAGKGRLQRHWYSPFGQNIYLSLSYPFNKDVSELAGLSLVIGLAICQTINDLYELPSKAQVKWPNDILYEQSKLAGTLIEIQAETNGFCSAIIGIGINVNMTDDHSQISQNWISLQKINHSYNDRNLLCAKLIDALIGDLEKFSTTGLAEFIQKWQANDGLANKLINLEQNTSSYCGIVTGINEQGHLLVKLEDGEIKAFSSGDTHIILK